MDERLRENVKLMAMSQNGVSATMHLREILSSTRGPTSLKRRALHHKVKADSNRSNKLRLSVMACLKPAFLIV
jgi:hypothetical protein